MKYAITLILLCSMAAFAQQADQPNHQTLEGKAPASVKPPVEWLQKYAMYLTKNAEAQQLRQELVAEMDKAGYMLDPNSVEWVPKVKDKPSAK